MSETEERFAHALREVASKLSDAIVEQHTAEADLKRTLARQMVTAEHEGHRSNNAQARQADLSDEVYDARINVGVATARVTALKVEWRRCEVAFETWRSKQASHRAERKVYGA